MRKVHSEPGRLTNTTYSSRYFTEDVPEHRIPSESMPARAAYQLIHDELNLDGNPSLNLASFVTTWMEPEAQELATESLNRNFVDQDEYPQTEEIHRRVVSMIGGLFNAPSAGEPCGTATIGSSEAIMLGLLAHKWSWRERRGDDSAKPNIVFGADVHTCWEKFTKYFDVEQRVIPLTTDRHTIGPEEVEPLIDENTIAVGAILGTTFTGQIDQIEGIDELLRRVKMPNYSLNFSRASNTVLLQYYNFLRLGRAGYERIAANLMENAGDLEKALVDSGRFELLNDSRYLPVVVVRPTDEGGGVNVFELSELLRELGWIVPAYPLPPNAESISVLRMVVKENFSRDMAEMLGEDIRKALVKMDGKPSPDPQAQAGGGQRRIC
jgi:glutamate/tyrosine decarboxylase-like PLP-dependent enzyme